MLVDKFLANVFGQVPDPARYKQSLIFFGPVDDNTKKITVYYNGVYLFKFSRFIGEHTPAWTKTGQWYELWIHSWRD